MLRLLIDEINILVCMKPPYEVSETGWGEFEVIIKIYFADPTERPVSGMLLFPFFIAISCYSNSIRNLRTF